MTIGDLTQQTFVKTLLTHFFWHYAEIFTLLTSTVTAGL